MRKVRKGSAEKGVTLSAGNGIISDSGRRCPTMRASVDWDEDTNKEKREECFFMIKNT